MGSDSDPNATGVLAEKTEQPAQYDAAVGHSYVKPQMRKIHDSAVTFDEYHYYANQTRAEELTLEAPKTNWKALMFQKKTSTENDANNRGSEHLPSGGELANRSNRAEITDQEWTNASRAYRTASGGACE